MTNTLDVKSEISRFVETVAAMTPTGQCVLWPYGKTRGGYGTVMFDGKRWRAHRLTLTLAIGPAPAGKPFALHAPHEVCGNTACVAPWHLRWGNQLENQRQMSREGRSLSGERNPVSKLTDAQAEAIRNDWRPLKHVAADYDISKAQVSRIRRGKSRKRTTTPEEINL